MTFSELIWSAWPSNLEFVEAGGVVELFEIQQDSLYFGFQSFGEQKRVIQADARDFLRKPADEVALVSA